MKKKITEDKWAILGKYAQSTGRCYHRSFTSIQPQLTKTISKQAYTQEIRDEKRKKFKHSLPPSLPPHHNAGEKFRSADFNLMHKISNISYRSNFSVIVMFSLDPYPLIISFVVNRRFARKALSFAIAIATLFENCSKTIARKITVEVAKH